MLTIETFGGRLKIEAGSGRKTKIVSWGLAGDRELSLCFGRIPRLDIGVQLDIENWDGTPKLETG